MEETCDMRVYIMHRPDFDRDGGASGVIKSILNPALKK
jgi:hypothetical protein